MAAKVTASDVKRARVTIELDGEEVVLIPSPDAIIVLSAKYDGFSPLLAALQRLHVQAAIDVVVAGAGVDGKDAKAMAATVVTTGAVDLMPKLVEFVMILANGGKPLSDDVKETADPS